MTPLGLQSIREEAHKGLGMPSLPLHRDLGVPTRSSGTPSDIGWVGLGGNLFLDSNSLPSAVPIAQTLVTLPCDCPLCGQSSSSSCLCAWYLSHFSSAYIPSIHRACLSWFSLPFCEHAQGGTCLFLSSTAGHGGQKELMFASDLWGEP